MTIAPIVRTVQVKAAPDRAFDLFANHIGQWWPRDKSIGKGPLTAVMLEPRAGGRWYETNEGGGEADWGRVLAWEPPGRLLLAWKINSQMAYDPDLVTEVELTFAPVEDGGTRVTLTHRNLERFGADAEKVAGQLAGGWPDCLEHFAEFTATQA
jgi:uncharacterized protein YndB with AHSA1/START domain